MRGIKWKEVHHESAYKRENVPSIKSLRRQNFEKK